MIEKVLRLTEDSEVSAIVIANEDLTELIKVLKEYKFIKRVDEIKSREIEILNKQLDVSNKLNNIILKRRDKYKEIVDKMEKELRNEFDILYCNPKSLKTFRSNERLIKHELLNRLNYYKKVK